MSSSISFSGLHPIQIHVVDFQKNVYIHDQLCKDPNRGSMLHELQHEISRVSTSGVGILILLNQNDFQPYIQILGIGENHIYKTWIQYELKRILKWIQVIKETNNSSYA